MQFSVVKNTHLSPAQGRGGGGGGGFLARTIAIKELRLFNQSVVKKQPRDGTRISWFQWLAPMAANPALLARPDGTLIPAPFQGECIALARPGVEFSVDNIRSRSGKCVRTPLRP